MLSRWDAFLCASQYPGCRLQSCAPKSWSNALCSHGRQLPADPSTTHPWPSTGGSIQSRRLVGTRYRTRSQNLLHGHSRFHRSHDGNCSVVGFELAHRIKDIKDQILYKIDQQQHYGNLDPILTGTVKIHLVRQAWDKAIRLIASIHERIVSASLILHRLGSFARRNRIHQALAEIGRVHKTLHILKALDDEEYRRRMGASLTN